MRRSADRSGRPRRAKVPMMALVALALAGVIAGCRGEAPPATPTDGGPPYLIRGRVVDRLDIAVPTKFVQITLADHANAAPGQPLSVIFQSPFGVAIDGSFEARVPVTPEIEAFAAKTDHVASFDVVAIGSDGNVVAVYVFSRSIKQGTWAGDVPFLTLRSEGESALDEHPPQ